MKTKVLFCLIVLLSFSANQVWAQEFDLSTFADDIEETMHKLEIGDKEVEKCHQIYKSLNKSLLNLNEEIMGINVKEVEGLIEKKFDAANKSFKEVLGKEEYNEIQSLNTKLSKSLIEALVGKRGLIGTNGLVDEKGMIGKKGARGQISIVVGTCIK